MIENFSTRFDDFPIGKKLLSFIKNPFLVVGTTEFSVKAKDIFKWVDAAKTQLELIEFQENVVVKKLFCDCKLENFWSKEGFSTALQILTMFGSTYCCESAFSDMNYIKNEFWIKMTNENLYHCLRLAVTTSQPRFKALAKIKNAISPTRLVAKKGSLKICFCVILSRLTQSVFLS